MILKLQQQTPEWLQVRVGRITASRVKDIMARGVKGQPLKKREDYLWEIVSERMTGIAVDKFVSSPMMWGTEHEGEARKAYTQTTGNPVSRAGIALHDALECLAASPDGLIGPEGLWEGKCPTTQQHLQYRLEGEVPDEYKDQCYTQMACWGREWVDFTSFDPRVTDESAKIFTKRLMRDEKRIAEILDAVREFDAEAQDRVDRLCGKDVLKMKLAASL